MQSGVIAGLLHSVYRDGAVYKRKQEKRREDNSLYIRDGSQVTPPTLIFLV